MKIVPNFLSQETKMKNEKRGQLLDKLVDVAIDTSLFSSSKAIGTSRDSKKQRIQRSLLEEKAILSIENNAVDLYEHRQPWDFNPLSVKMDSSLMEIENLEPVEIPQEAETCSWGAMAGSGLKRPYNHISQIPPSKRAKTNIEKEVLPQRNYGIAPSRIDSSDEWAGFSDSSKSTDEVLETDLSESSDLERTKGEEKSRNTEEYGLTAKANAFKHWAMSQKADCAPREAITTSSNIDAVISLKIRTLPAAGQHEEDKTPAPAGPGLLITRKVPYLSKFYSYLANI